MPNPSVASLLEQGHNQLDQEEYQAALQIFQQAAVLEPQNPQVSYELGLTCYRLEQYQESIEYLNQALRIKPNYILALVRRGLACLKIDQAQQAQADFDQAIALTPQDSEDWQGRAIALNELQRYEEAIASYDQVLKFNANNNKTWNIRGIALSVLERYEEAVAFFDKVLKIHPNNVKTRNIRGIALGNLKRYEEAVASFDQALNINANNDETWNNQGIALVALKRYEEAVASFDQALKINPNNDETWNNQGIALVALKRYKEAVASFDKALKINPNNDETWNNQGIALGNLESYEKAVTSFDKALKINPKNDEACYYQGNVLRNLGRYKEAVVSYDKAIELKPDKHEALVNKGNVLVKLKRDTEAIEFYNRALNCIDPQWWEAWNKNQGLANISARNEEAAVKISEQKLTPNDRQTSKSHPEKWKQLQYFMMQQPSLFSDLSEAKKSYEEALEFLTFDDFPEKHLQFKQELLKVKVCLSDNPEEFQETLEEGTQQLEESLKKCKSEQERITLARKFAPFNQMRVDILAQSKVVEKHIEALVTAEVRKNTCLAWLSEGLIYKPSTDFEFEQTEKLLNPKTAAIYWHLSPIAITTFIIKHNQSLKILLPQLPRESQQGSYSRYFYQLQRFESWMQQWKKSYQDYRKVPDTNKETTPWRKNMKYMLETLGEILQIKRIVQDNLQDVDNLILIPHRELHLLPLDYLFKDKDKDKDKDFIITYLPSFQIGLQLLELTSNSEKTDSLKLLNIEMSLNNLSFTAILSAALYHLYPSYGKLPDLCLTNTNLIKALGEYEGYFHFTGHGSHNLDKPRESALELGDNEKLTLADICECPELDLRKYQLICLSACETGITSPEFSKERIIDEYVGLVSAFLAKGANYVLSTLWRVEEDSTALLIIKFYQLLKQKPTPSIALRQAKDWLRHLTYKDLAEWYRNLSIQLNEPQSKEFLETEAENIENDIKEKKKEFNQLPYAHPYYWAGFILTGKPSTTG